MNIRDKKLQEYATSQAMQVPAISETNSIVFVTLAENGAIDDVTAGEHQEVFEEWKPNIAYKANNIRRYEDKLYKCIQPHTSQPDWSPDVAASLWRNIADPAEEYPEWSQPVGASDAYEMGAKVSHNGKHWVSNVDNNVWEPGVFGWDEVLRK